MSAKKISFLSLIVISIFGFAHTNAQNQKPLTWNKIFHYGIATGADIAVETPDSGFLMTMGYMKPDSTWVNFLLKIDKYGDTVWRKKDIGGGMKSIQKAPGLYSYMVDGGAKYDSAKKKWIDDYHITDFNDKGEVVWRKDFITDSGHYLPGSIFPLKNKNYLVLGALFQDALNRYGPFKGIAQKFNAFHNLVWSDTFSMSRQTGYSVALETRQGNIFIGGIAGQNLQSNAVDTGFLLLLDSNGKYLHRTIFPFLPDSVEAIYNIKQLSNGNIVVHSSDATGRAVYLTLTDSAGNIKSRKQIHGLDNGSGGIEVDADSVFLFGSVGFLDGPLVLAKLDTAFELIWFKYLDDTSGFYNNPRGILKTSDGGILLQGIRIWENAPINERWYDVALFKFERSANFYRPKMHDENKCDIVYPNPAFGNIHFYHNLLPNPDLSLNLNIYDVRGRLIITYKQIESTEEDKDINFLKSGLYFYRLYNNDHIYCTGEFIKE
jgi:hypothetical protein